MAKNRAPAVRARGLVKKFGSLTAVDAIDFEVAAGECVGFLGPNGAGKTSALRMIYCASPVSGGELEVFGLRPGRDDRAIKARLGVVPQGDNLDADLSVEENLVLFARYHGIGPTEALHRADELLRFVEIEGRAHDAVGALSGGMRRRLSVARALINAPELIVLDEPTTGLDPQVRHHIWERVAALRAQGVTLILSTHDMNEAERLCDRLFVLDRGRIIAEGAPQYLVAANATTEVVEVYQRDVKPRDVTEVLRVAAELCPRHIVTADRIVLFTGSGRALADRLAPRQLSVRHPNLEDVFLLLTGRRLAE